jgi:beta-N-acetylhexosaminidase
MEMDAIAKTVGTAQGAVYALAAGADCVLISHSIDLAAQAVDRIVAAVESGELSEARLREAFDRVQKLRAGLQPPIDMAAPAPHPQIGKTIGLRAVTIIRGELACDAESTVVVSFEGTTTEGVQGTHSAHTSLCAYVPGLEQLDAPLEPSAAATERLMEELQRSGRRPLVLMRRAHIYESQRRAVERILGRHPDAVLVSVREPFDVDCFTNARNLGAAYGDEAPSMYGLAQVVFAHAPVHGAFPVRWAAVR